MWKRVKVYFFLTTAIIATVAIISGCSKRVSTSEVTEKAAPTEEVVKPAPTPEPVEEAPVPEMEEGGEVAIKGKEEMREFVPSQQVMDIYFEFDQYVIRSDARKTLFKNAKILKNGNYKKIVIEGHCDERGTSTYNLALGERRAEATKRYLVSLGVDSRKISIISYGKEKPFCNEHNEDCWQQNRRAHFVVE